MHAVFVFMGVDGVLHFTRVAGEAVCRVCTSSRSLGRGPARGQQKGFGPRQNHLGMLLGALNITDPSKPVPE